MSSLLIGKSCLGQTSLSAWAQASDLNILVASWDDTGLMEFGVQFWKMENFTGFDLLGGTGCGEIDFWEAILD